MVIRFCVVTDDRDAKQMKHLPADNQELLNCEDLDSTDSSEEYVLYSQSRRR